MTAPQPLAFGLSVERRPGRFRYETTGDAARLAGAAAVIAEGDTWSVVEQHADGTWAWLTITTETDLELVGLTAAFAPALAERHIPTNVLAGHQHDHLLVPDDRADEAIEVITGLHAAASVAADRLPFEDLLRAAELVTRLPAPGFGALLELLGRPEGATDSDVAGATSDRAEVKARFGYLAVLRDAGIVTTSHGVHRFDPSRPVPLASRLRAIAAGPLEVPEQLAGYVDNGRLARYPRSPDDLEALLAVVAAHLGPGTVLGERAITARLATIALEPVELRRRLVDAGLVERTSTGSRYLVRPLP